ncbi:FAD binding domain-containing protein [Streptomyces sp. NPDC050738]|uniref:FAD binding domain-containing protein n=1 Tax=Streptomyces sp. NPDC050738 TaxID=3154744 RepID=UPI003424924B
MKPTRFVYLQPESVDEAVACLQTYGPRARVLAGGQSLLALMNRRTVRPSAVIDLKRLTRLRGMAQDNGVLSIGALTTHHDIESAQGHGLDTAFRVLPETARLIGHLPVRTRGTLGGSLAQADPCAEWCLAAVLLDAEIVVRGSAGPRTIAAGELFTGAGQTVLDHAEIITGIRFPTPAPTAALVEFAVQQGNLPLVAAGAVVETSPYGAITSARVALAGAAATPVRVPLVEQALLGEIPGEALFRHAGDVLAGVLDPPPDPRADGPYRTELASTLLVRALRESTARAHGSAQESHAGRREEEKAGAR